MVDGEVHTLLLPAGQYLKVAATGLRITIAGQQLTADLSIEKINRTTPTVVNTLKISFANVGLRLGPVDRPVVVVSNGTGTFEIAPAGIAGQMSVDIALDVPGVTLSGSFALQLNTTGSTQTVGGVPIANGVKVTGTDVVLGIAGQRLTGSFTVEQNPTTKEVGLALDMTLELGNGTEVLVAIGVEGILVFTPQGVAADLTASLELGESLQTRLAGKFEIITPFEVTLKINTGVAAVDRSITLGGTTYHLDVPAGPYFLIQAGSVDAEDVTHSGGVVHTAGTVHRVGITVMGQSLSGVFSFSQTTTANGTKVVRIGFDHVELFLGDPEDPTPSNGEDDRTGLLISNGQGALLLLPGGMAGSFSADVGLTKGLTDKLGGSFTTTVNVQINTLTTNVNDSVEVGGASLPLVLPRGPYLRASINNAQLTFGNYRLSGSFLFEKATDYGPDGVTGGDGPDLQVLTIAMLGLTLAERATSSSPFVPKALSNISGVLLIISRGSETGYVLNLRASINGQVLSAVVNTLHTPVDRTVVVNGSEIRVKAGSLPTGTYINVGVEDVAFDFGGVLEIRGDFVLDGNGFHGTNLEVFVGKGPSTDDDAIGILITNATVDFFKFDNGTYAINVSGTVALIGLDGLQISGNVSFRINTNTVDCVTTPTPNCGGLAIAGQTFALIVSDLHLGVAGVLDISGTLAVGRQPNGTLDLAIANARVIVALGGTGIVSLEGYAAFSISPTTGFRLSGFKVTSFELFPTVVPGDFAEATAGPSSLTAAEHPRPRRCCSRPRTCCSRSTAD